MEAPRRRDGLHVRQIEGQTVILDPETDRMHTLNATAAFVFEAIDGLRHAEEIAEELAECFDVDGETAVADTRKLVAKLSELKIVV